MKRLLGVLFALVLVFSLAAIALPSPVLAAQPSEAWVARYDGPASDYETAWAISVDGFGNVYVTGWSPGIGTGRDYATIKYDPDGNELWVARYDGPASGDDTALAIAVDSSGNVYVTGQSHGIGTYSDYATIKYDSDGNELWVARYDGPEGFLDSASAIALDGSGNVCVTGGSRGIGDDYATIKYDSEGHELWVARYDGPINWFDYAHAIAVDDWGNFYVTGMSHGSGSGPDYATIKYDFEGTELWVARYDGLASDTDVAEAIAVDGSGNVYVTGFSPDTGTDKDYATIKYDFEGTELWIARYDGPVSGNDQAYAVAVDLSGNVCVTGGSEGSGTDSDTATVRYDPSGNELWVARYDGPVSGFDKAVAMAVDGSGNAYVTGQSHGIGTYSDYATIKYDPDGQEVWAARYHNYGYEGATALALDGQGNVYVTGYSPTVGTSWDYVTIKYIQEAPPASEIWVDDDYTPGGYNDGHTWDTDAFATIQDGIDAVDSPGTVHVAARTYTGAGNVNIDFKGKAITVRSVNGAATTIIDCENAHNTRGFIFQSGETTSSVLDGFTITNGWMDGLPGGGIYISSASPSIVNSIITGNRATWGGGIHISSASPSIINSIITGNTAGF